MDSGRDSGMDSGMDLHTDSDLEVVHRPGY